MLIVMGLNASTIMDLAKEIILYGGQYWFLTSLFLARIIYWLISKYLNKPRFAHYSIFTSKAPVPKS